MYRRIVLPLLTLVVLVASSLIVVLTPTGIMQSDQQDTPTPTQGPMIVLPAVFNLVPCPPARSGRARLCGQVVRPQGTPILGANVQVFRKTGSTSWQSGPTETTNTVGRFEFDLVPAEYALKIWHSSHGSEWFDDKPDPGGPFPPSNAGTVLLSAGDVWNDIVVVLGVFFTPTPTITASVTPTSTPTATSVIPKVTVMPVDCARIDFVGDMFSVCAFRPQPPRDLEQASATPSTPNPEWTPSPTPTPLPPIQCPITISFIVPCASPLFADIRLNPPSPGGPNAMTCSSEPVGTVCTATLQSDTDFLPKTVHEIWATYSCESGTEITWQIGWTGLCDPKGNVRESLQNVEPSHTPEGPKPTPTPGPSPTSDVLVTLYYLVVTATPTPAPFPVPPVLPPIPKQPDAPGSHDPFRCYINESPPPAPAAVLPAPSFYWGKWSGVPIEIPGPRLVPATTAQLPSGAVTIRTDVNGDYAFLTQPGHCYVVHVEHTDPSNLWDTYSPAVGNSNAPGATAIEDLDLTRYE